MGAIKDVVTDFMESRGISWEEAELILSRQGALTAWRRVMEDREAGEALVGKVFALSRDAYNLEFALPYDVTVQLTEVYLLYYQIVLNDFPVVQSTSNTVKGFGRFWHPATSEQRTKAIEGFIQGQQRRVDSLQKDLDDATDRLTFLQGIRDGHPN